MGVGKEAEGTLVEGMRCKEIEIPVTLIWKVQPLQKEIMVALLDSGVHMCFISKRKTRSLQMYLEV